MLAEVLSAQRVTDAALFARIENLTVLSQRRKLAQAW